MDKLQDDFDRLSEFNRIRRELSVGMEPIKEEKDYIICLKIISYTLATTIILGIIVSIPFIIWFWK